MKTKKILMLVTICLLGAGMLFAEGGQEQSGAAEKAVNFPTKTITIVNPWSAGGGSDVMARMIGSYLEKYIGKSVVVVNKPGSGGEVGFAYIQNSKPDGHTIGLTNTPNFLSFPLMRDVSYDWDEFRPLINVVTDPGVIVVLDGDDRFPDLKGFLDYTRDNEGNVALGNSGVGGDDYIAAMFLQDQANVTFNNVAFGGAGPNRTALLGGHIDAAAINASEAVQYVESKQLRVLAVMDDKRYEDLPNVPTFKELGYDIISGSSRGISAPPGTPDEVVDILCDAFEKAAKDPEFLAQAEKAMLPLDIRIGDDYRELRDSLADNLKKLYEKFPW
jgi:tripartite-type tricarboxylate transporter receptor subunit TctC